MNDNTRSKYSFYTLTNRKYILLFSPKPYWLYWFSCKQAWIWAQLLRVISQGGGRGRSYVLPCVTTARARNVEIVPIHLSRNFPVPCLCYRLSPRSITRENTSNSGSRSRSCFPLQCFHRADPSSLLPSDFRCSAPLVYPLFVFPSYKRRYIQYI